METAPMLLLVALCPQMLACLQYAAQVNLSSPMPPTLKASCPPYSVKDASNTSWCRRTLPELTLLTFISYSGQFLPLGPLCTEGIQIALDVMKANGLLKIFDKYNLIIENYDGKGLKPIAVPLFIRKMRETADRTDNVVPIVTLSVCPEAQYAASMLHHFNAVGLAAASITLDIYTDRNMYKSFFPILNMLTNAYGILADFIEYNGWKKVALLSETQVFYLEVENMISDLLIARNISLTATVRIPLLKPGSIPDHEAMEAAVQELHWKDDPRIIILHSSISPMIACYLHRFGMYGPGYVIMMSGAAFFLPNNPLRYPWCTDTMLYEVLKSSFFFSDGTAFVSNWNLEDSQGISRLKFDNELRARINNPEQSSFWTIMRTFCYDTIVTTVTVLDAVEKSLNEKRNETLQDWAMPGPKFQQNGELIADLIKSSLYTIKMRGQMDEIDLTEYDDRTNMPTKMKRSGLSVIFQLQNDTPVISDVGIVTSSSLKTVILMQLTPRNNASLVRIGPGKMKWQTLNGQSPPDTERIVLIQMPAINRAIPIVLTCCAAVLLVPEVLAIAAFCLAIFNVKIRILVRIKRSMACFYVFMLAGTLLMNVFVLLSEPCIADASKTACLIAIGCLHVGYTLANGSLSVLLELGLIFHIQRRTRKINAVGAEQQNNVPDHLQNPSTSLPAGNLIEIELVPSGKVARQHQSGPSLMSSSQLQVLPVQGLVMLSVWIVCSAALVGVAVELEPPEQTVYLTGSSQRSKTDSSISYQFFIRVCKLNFRSPNNGGEIAAIVWYGIHFVALLRAIFLSYFLRKKQCSRISLLSHMCCAVYAINFMIAAVATLIGACYYNANGQTSVIISVAILYFSVIVVILNGSIIYHRLGPRT